MRPRDTTEEALEAQRAAYRELGPTGRVELAFKMSEEARALSIQGILRRDPSLSPEEARMILLRRILGDELYGKAWPVNRGR